MSRSVADDERVFDYTHISVDTYTSGVDQAVFVQAAIDRVNSLDDWSVIRFPDGDLEMGTPVTLRASENLTLRGAGIDRTVFRSTQAATPHTMFSLDESGGIKRLIVEDATFDANETGFPFRIAKGVEEVVFRRCRFVNWRVAIRIDEATEVNIEDCQFDGCNRRYTQFQALNIMSQGEQGGSKIRVVRNSFRAVWGSAIVGRVGTYHVQDVQWHDNDMDGLGFYSEPTQVCSVSAVIDADEVTLDCLVIGNINTTWLKYEELAHSGTATDVDGNALTDTGAAFANLRRGDIVKIDGRIGLILEADPTRIAVEGWLDAVTMLPAKPPTPGSAYEVYTLCIGIVKAKSGNDIRVEQWLDLDGQPCVGPPVGAMVSELSQGTFGLQVNTGVRSGIVSRNHIRRFQGDQIAWQADDGSILNNHIEDGGDVGITLWGEGSSAVGNHIERQGGAGILNLNSHGVTIASNTIIGGSVRRPTSTLGGLVLGISSLRTNVVGNYIDGGGYGGAKYGISCRNGASEHHIVANKIERVSEAGINFDNAVGLHVVEIVPSSDV